MWACLCRFFFLGRSQRETERKSKTPTPPPDIWRYVVGFFQDTIVSCVWHDLNSTICLPSSIQFPCIGLPFQCLTVANFIFSVGHVWLDIWSPLLGRFTGLLVNQGRDVPEIFRVLQIKAATPEPLCPFFRYLQSLENQAHRRIFEAWGILLFETTIKIKGTAVICSQSSFLGYARVCIGSPPNLPHRGVLINVLQGQCGGT